MGVGQRMEADLDWCSEQEPNLMKIAICISFLPKLTLLFASLVCASSSLYPKFLISNFCFSLFPPKLGFIYKLYSP